MPIVYGHVRTLCEVIKSHYHPSVSQHSASHASALGDHAATYLVAHGYTVASIDTIVCICHSSSRQQFPLELTVHGMSLAEATYLHELIDHWSERIYYHITKCFDFPNWIAIPLIRLGKSMHRLMQHLTNLSCGVLQASGLPQSHMYSMGTCFRRTL